MEGLTAGGDCQQPWRGLTPTLADFRRHRPCRPERSEWSAL